MTLARAATIAKSLGHTGRLRILSMLQAGPLSVCQIAIVLDTPVSTVSGHIAELRHAGLLCEERRGKWAFCRLPDGNDLAPLMVPLLNAIAEDVEVNRDLVRATSVRQQTTKYRHDCPAPAAENPADQL